MQKSILALSLLTLFGAPVFADTMAYRLDQTFQEDCSDLPHLVSHLALPGGVTCVTEAVNGVVYRSNGGNQGATTMFLGLALCKDDPAISLRKIQFGCKNN